MITALPQTSPTPPASPTSPASSAAPSLDPNMFITLLIAQLKNQDPTSPMDPTQFVGQLVQFNSLEQLISINQELQPPAPSSGSGSTGGAANPPAASQ